MLSVNTVLVIKLGERGDLIMYIERNYPTKNNK
jgi:hypothetical protein